MSEYTNEMTFYTEEQEIDFNSQDCWEKALTLTNLFQKFHACRENDFDDIMIAVAKDVTTDNQIESIGKALGVSVPDIQRCLQTNKSGAGVNSTGTIAMLREWQHTVREKEEKSLLRAALINARLIRIAEHFPEDIR